MSPGVSGLATRDIITSLSSLPWLLRLKSMAQALPLTSRTLERIPTYQIQAGRFLRGSGTLCTAQLQIMDQSGRPLPSQILKTILIDFAEFGGIVRASATSSSMRASELSIGVTPLSTSSLVSGVEVEDAMS